MSQQDPATHYILERISDLSHRIEDALRMLEKRTEQSAVMREQLSTVQRGIDDIWSLLRGEGIDRPGLQQQFHAVASRLDLLEEALDELDGTARLSRVEEAVKQLLQKEGQAASLLVEDRKGQWSLTAESRRAKFALLALVVTALLGWAQSIVHFLAQLLKK